MSGRFALEPILDKHEIVDNIKLLELTNKYTINNSLNLENGKILISYKPSKDSVDLNISPKVSLTISTIISANARIWLSNLKNKKKIYYIQIQILLIHLYY